MDLEGNLDHQHEPLLEGTRDEQHSRGGEASSQNSCLYSCLWNALGLLGFLVYLGFAIPCLPLFIYYGIFAYNNYDLEIKKGRLLRNRDVWTAWIEDIAKDSTYQDLLFDYEHQGLLFDVFIRFPLNCFNFFRHHVLCFRISRHTVGLIVSVFTSFVMLAFTYYCIYWICMFMIKFYNTLGTDYEYSDFEKVLSVITTSIDLYLAMVFCSSFLYFSWSREIARLFTRFENEYLPKKVSSKDQRKFNELGVTFAFIEEFIDVNGGWDQLKGLTTTDVCDRFVKDQTRASGVSYSEMKLLEGNNGVKKATVFISHAWRFEFLEVIKALRFHFGADVDSVVIWFDLFSNNQNDTANIPFEWWCGTFQHSIKSIGHTVAVFLPWEHPIPLQRVWCLWEIFISQRTKVRFQIAMGPKEEQRFVNSISMDADAFNRMISNIDVQQSQAWKDEDRERIFRVIESTVGFHQVNEKVIRFLRNQLFNTLEERTLAQSPADPDRLKMLRALCLVSQNLGKLKESLNFRKSLIQESLKIYGANHETTLEAYQIYCDTCLRLGYGKAALQLAKDLAQFMRHLQARVNLNSPLMLRTQILLGAALRAGGDENQLELSILILSDCVNQLRSLKTGGGSGAALDMFTIRVYLDLSEAYLKKSEVSNSQSDLSSSLQYCEEGIALLQQENVSETHLSYVELKLQKAIILRSIPDLKQVFIQLEEKFGLIHPTTVTCLLALNKLMNPHDGRRYALILAAVCKEYYSDDLQHNNVYKSKFFIELYTINLLRFYFFMFFSLIFFGLCFYFSWIMLQHQHDTSLVRTNMILTGFFFGLALIFIFITDFFVERFSSFTSDDDNFPSLLFTILPLSLHRLRPFIMFFFYLLFVTPCLVLGHLMQVNRSNFGYFIGGNIAGVVSMLLIGICSLRYFNQRNLLWQRKNEVKAAFASIHLQMTKIDSPPPPLPIKNQLDSDRILEEYRQKILAERTIQNAQSVARTFLNLMNKIANANASK